MMLALLWLVALMRLDLSFAYPFIGLTYVIVLVGAAVFFNDRTPGAYPFDLSAVHLKAKGGEPTKTSSGVTPSTSRA